MFPHHPVISHFHPLHLKHMLQFEIILATQLHSKIITFTIQICSTVLFSLLNEKKYFKNDMKFESSTLCKILFCTSLLWSPIDKNYMKCNSGVWISGVTVFKFSVLYVIIVFLSMKIRKSLRNTVCIVYLDMLIFASYDLTFPVLLSYCPLIRM